MSINASDYISYDNKSYFKLYVAAETCTKMNVSSISFKGFATEDVWYIITVNGQPYGNQSLSIKNTYTNVIATQNLSNLTSIQIEINVYCSTAKPVTSIDDLTINGSTTAAVSKLETIRFPNSNNPPSERCQGLSTVGYNANYNTPLQSISYTLDDASLAAGVTMTANAVVTYPASFKGTASITANAIGCANEIWSKTYNVTTSPTGPPLVDMDFATSYPYEGTCSTCGNLKNRCSTAGFIYQSGFNGKTIQVKVRFQADVRNFEITGRPTGDDFIRPGFQLFFLQSDFDNYKGSSKLPKGPTDADGMKNLRLRIVAPNPTYGGTVQVIKPTLSWNSSLSMWVATYKFSYQDLAIPWPAENFKVYLSDAGGGLPVKLESFSAKQTPEGNRLTWKTTEEIDFSHFEVERSDDPRQGFQYLATVSSGNNATGGSYRYTDIQNATSQQYYRLKMVDIDGSFEYSRIVNVNAHVSAGDLLAYPNPAQNVIYLGSPDDITSVKMFDQKGNAVFGKSYLEGEKSISIPLPKLNAGTYILKVNPGTDNQQVKKIIIR